MIYNLSLYETLKRVLTELNVQVVEHGERLSYLYLKLSELRNEPHNQHMEEMMITCFSHDIGSYKTDKFADLLNFDAKNTFEHCIYGYLFMKHFSFLKEKAEVFLYHHTPYNQKSEIDSRYVDDGILVHFLDRVDILNIAGKTSEEIIEKITENKGKLFNPKDVDDFIRLENEQHVLEILREDKYHDDVKVFFDVDDRVKRLIGPITNMLAYEIDFRSEQTVVHSITTSVIAKCLAERMNLSKLTVYEIESAGRMHDLGKIKIPIDIVEKPGKLTPEEYEIMKKHSEYTKEIIKDLFPESIVSMSYRHHERLDGSGYPQGLTAKDLSVNDRIIQVADIVSALIYKRSYRDALDKQTVISIMTKETEEGKFDKDIVKILIDDYDAIISETVASSKEVINSYENLQNEYREYLKKYSNLENNNIEEYELFTLR